MANEKKKYTQEREMTVAFSKFERMFTALNIDSDSAVYAIQLVKNSRPAPHARGTQKKCWGGGGSEK